MVIRPIRADEIPISAALHAAGRQELWQQLAAEEGIDLTRQMVAERDGGLAGACLYQINPGRAAMVFVPAVSAADPDGEAAVRLIRAARDAAVAAGAHLCQALLTPDAVAAHKAFQQAGFRRLAVLLHMERALPAPPAEKGDLQFVPYSAANQQRFAEVIERSYEGSQDCPALNGRRTREDVLASHRATGTFAPDHWLLARREGVDVGCLLLNRSRLAWAWEIVYVGVPPEHRGRGYGRRLVSHALVAAHAAGARTILLAVDEANAPAVRMYQRLGFRTCQRTVAFVCFADDPR